jgi:hypothetical protein
MPEMSSGIKIKYLIVKLHEVNKTVAILFPNVDGLSHRDVARLHSASSRAVIGAGFCEISYDIHQLTVYGESETVKMSSKSEDADAIRELLGWNKS